MKMKTYGTYEEMSDVAAEVFAEQIRIKPDCVLGLATGSTPIGTYQRLVEMNKKGEISFAKVRTANLDEYVRLPPEHDQSYRYFMQENLFNHVDIKPENTHLPSSTSSDEDCVKYDELVAGLGGVDLFFLGIGHNGHIGFNEPDEHFTLPTHKVALTESTIRANSRLFAGGMDEVPREAITMGIGGIFAAKKIILLAGADKAEIVKQAFTGPITPKVPASILQLHQDITVMYVE